MTTQRKLYYNRNVRSLQVTRSFIVCTEDTAFDGFPHQHCENLLATASLSDVYSTNTTQYKEGKVLVITACYYLSVLCTHSMLRVGYFREYLWMEPSPRRIIT